MPPNTSNDGFVKQNKNSFVNMTLIQLPETVHSDVEPLDELIDVIMPCKFIIYHDAKIFV